MQKPLGMVNIDRTLRFPAAQEERKASYITSFSSKNNKMICFKQTIGIKSCFFSCKTKSKHNEMIFYMSFCSMLCLYVPNVCSAQQLQREESRFLRPTSAARVLQNLNVHVHHTEGTDAPLLSATNACFSLFVGAQTLCAETLLHSLNA